MRLSSFLTRLVPAIALFALGATGCSSSIDSTDSSEQNLDYYSQSAKEYFVSGTSTVTLESTLSGATDAAKEARAKELVALKNVGISWFLNQYLATKEDEDANKSYGGFSALTKFSSETDAAVKKTGELTYSFTYKVEVAGQKQLVEALPGTSDGAGGKTFTLQVGKVSNDDLARLDTNHEWYRSAPWGTFDPTKVSADNLESIDMAIVAQLPARSSASRRAARAADGSPQAGARRRSRRASSRSWTGARRGRSACRGVGSTRSRRTRVSGSSGRRP